MVTSGFHHWQFHVLNSGAERLVVVMWLGLWEIFFLSAPILELEIPGSLVPHSTTMPWWLLVFTSNNFQVFNSSAEGVMVVFFCLGLWEISFSLHHDSSKDLWISNVALYHYAMVTSCFNIWQFKVFNCGADLLTVVLFWWIFWMIFSYCIRNWTGVN